MKDSDWREQFQPWILERGRNYWKAAKELALLWRSQYSRRSAMADELRKAGF